ncbi:hypothetical protein B0H14DRAFT_3678003 [Mycena olivaceomarginata]|nr:hypothetical protein B0H14DRAFT_3678003 [Mycena olivaceomarginata]
MSSTTSSSRPSFVRSKTMPAFRRAILLPSVDKALGSLLASSSKGIRRIFSFSRSSTSSASVLKACPSTCSVPAFTMPDYTISTTAPPPPISVSPLTRLSFKRAMTMPAPMRCAAQGILRIRRRLYVLFFSVTSSSPSSAFTRRRPSTSTLRRSPVSSVESFSSTEKQVTLALQLCALPSSVTGVLPSLMAVIILLLLPAMTPQPPRCVLALRPYEREIVLTEEQGFFPEQNSPRLPPPSILFSRISPGFPKNYQRTVRRAACAQHATTPKAALGALFTPTPKRMHAEIPAPVDPKTLAADIPLVVYYSRIALSESKGPAPAVGPARRTRMCRRGVLSDGRGRGQWRGHGVRGLVMCVAPPHSMRLR